MADLFNDDNDDEELDQFIELLLQPNNQQDNIILNKDGSERKVKRDDYSRGAKRPKSQTPWQDCRWLIMIQHPDVRDPDSRLGKEFRRKFRTPFPVFTEIIRICKETDEPEFNVGQYNEVSGETNIPLEGKVLAVLRVLANGLKFNDASELAECISESHLNYFFKRFCYLFRLHFAEKWIHPLKGQELLKQLNESDLIGVPGMIGSVDTTYFPWEQCHANLKNVMTGAHGTALLYETVVTNNRLVIYISEKGFYGTTNDKISVQHSKFIDDLKTGRIYKNVTYRIRTGEGQNDYVELSKCFVVADGGYIDIPEIISAFDPSFDPVKYKFSDWIGSVGKDVDRFFGILKQRFRWLKNPITGLTGSIIAGRFDRIPAGIPAGIARASQLKIFTFNNLHSQNRKRQFLPK